ncbi:hypothetical protein ACIQWZ_11085 [Streptomyces sp. NPDC098077]|uniref:hypothetical protein n=1 Tax=Streptomyces sp. NPDC098077 TaxID=3366093 RepID=UPI003816B211
MAEVIAMLEELRGVTPLTAEAAAARFLAHEWTPGGKTRDGVETSWDKGSAGGWIRTFGGGAVSVSFFVWIRDVDEASHSSRLTNRVVQRWRPAGDRADEWQPGLMRRTL